MGLVINDKIIILGWSNPLRFCSGVYNTDQDLILMIFLLISHRNTYNLFIFFIYNQIK